MGLKIGIDVGGTFTDFLVAGEGEEAFIPLLTKMCKQLWSAYCAFAPGAVAPVEGLLKFFEEEIREHISQKRCPFE